MVDKILFESGSLTTIECPQCGARLVVRTNSSNYSQFLGCSGYPDCKYTTCIPESWRLKALGAPMLPGMEEV